MEWRFSKDIEPQKQDEAPYCPPRYIHTLDRNPNPEILKS
jgi:hypothetical protein